VSGLFLMTLWVGIEGENMLRDDTSDQVSGTATGATGHQQASATKAYHNGGVEGDSFAEWYDTNLASQMDAVGSDGHAGDLVLDLSDAGAAFAINVGTNPETGLLGGSVEFQGADGQPVAWGHFDGVVDIILPDDPTSYYYTEADFEIVGEHGPGLPPKVELDAFITAHDPEDPEGPIGSGGSKGSGSGGSKGSGSGGSKGSGSGGSKGSGSGGSKGSGSGGSKGSGSGGSKGSGSGGSKGSGSGGSKGSGSGGSKGSGSGGSKGSGSGGSKGSGSGGSKGSGSGSASYTSHYASAQLPAYQPHADDIADLMTQDIDEHDHDVSGTQDGSSGGTYGDIY
jgi:hypothetical protein